ncbi:uncharacterized protein DUF664 [Williamsia limnetica]|uniref:Uncharacterized protein DUF664 n=1 Tax=Williamsia limnetica TaxID=882452 RepID=A0A318RLB7_WILLI|nr:DinB family protein [Williamsia limnetica]PYE19113.1 uncharacterized protein DUF664 [Williamsia limnetica]
MKQSDILVDAFDRIHEVVHAVFEDLPPEALTYRIDPDANTIAWLVWHLTRVQDDHVAGVAGSEQVWTSNGWAERFGLPFDSSDIGYGQSSADVAAVPAERELLLGYHDATHKRTLEYLRSLSPADLDVVVDENWTPAVTLGVRLISVIADDLQHAGQAAYVAGVYRRLQS